MAKIFKTRIGEYLQTAFRILDQNDGQLPLKELVAQIGQQLSFSSYEQERHQKTGYVRWVSVLHFYSIYCVKAGWLRKDKGVWYLTEEGRNALKLAPEAFVRQSGEKYKEWKSRQDGAPTTVETETEAEEPETLKTTTTVFQEAEADAYEEITRYIASLHPYEFQDLVAALLRGMGYFTPFTAPKGKDGGIDVVAYKDPIGAETPRIRIQVKHRPDTKVSRAEVGDMISNLHKEGYAGVIVSSGGFSPDSLTKIREANVHIEAIDLKTFITLWEKHYDRLSAEDKNLLPLKSISFLAPRE